ncbi:unnamed protein product [Clavelina lepadiformis]|uniref:Uncharacterized protein n=1 Tax=Clavelina lepadiformis TaxID=159417 RepID=A0ABP0GZS2_CLALP
MSINSSTFMYNRKEHRTEKFLNLTNQVVFHHARPTQYDMATNYNKFGLCAGCFHGDELHHHYKVPVRTGGGYTIYRKHRIPWQGLSEHKAMWKTIRWLSDVNNADPPTEDYATTLFDQFVNNGGDPAAMKEYLDSNFSKSLLEKLRYSGINVDLVAEYSELYRCHIQSLLQKNLQNQSIIAKKHDEDLQYTAIWTRLKKEGIDIEALDKLLKHRCENEDAGRYTHHEDDVSRIVSFLNMIPDHSKNQFLICRLEECAQKEELNHENQIFINFLESGGTPDVLREYVDSYKKTISTSSEAEKLLLENLPKHFQDKSNFRNCLEQFVRNQLRFYESARLLQEFIENKGDLNQLKALVNADCDMSTIMTEDDTSRHLLEDISNKFAEDNDRRKTLIQFPNEPEVLEFYIKVGGDFTSLVKALAKAMDSPNLEIYIKQKTNQVLEMFFLPNALENSDRYSENRTLSMMIPKWSTVYLLPKVLQTAKADLMFDEVIAAKQNLKENEGLYLSKAMEVRGIFTTATQLQDQLTTQQTSYSTDLDGGISNRKETLWIPPKPFEVKRIKHPSSKPRSPFSTKRYFHIKALTENHIMKVTKTERKELDMLRKKFKITQEENGMNYCKSERLSNEPILNQDDVQKTTVAENKQFLEVKQLPKKDNNSRNTRRQQQREKLIAIKVASRNATPNMDIPMTPEHQVSLPEQKPFCNGTQCISMENSNSSQLSSFKNEDFSSPFVEIKITKTHESNYNIKDTEDTHGQDTDDSYEVGKSVFGSGIGCRRKKTATSSHLNLLTLKGIENLRDNPDTLVHSSISYEQVLSESNTDFSLVSTKDLRHARKQTPKEINVTNNDSRLKHLLDYPPYITEKEVADILKQNSIIREDRLPLYRRLFEKYVLVRNIRKREKAIKAAGAQQNDDELHYGRNDSTKAELEKMKTLLKGMREQMTNVQKKIGIAKEKLNDAISTGASEKCTKVKPNSIAESENSKRCLCEADSVVRERKLVLIQLREKIREMRIREKSLIDKCRILQFKTDCEKIEKGISSQILHHSLKKKDMHVEVENEDTIELCDLKAALSDLDPNSLFLDNSQLNEELSEKGITLRVFVVIAALQERNNIDQTVTASLSTKLRICKQHYNKLVGPSLETLHVELCAAGIDRNQSHSIIQQFSRKNSGELDFLDFVTYVPLFLNIHRKIVNNPLS